MFKSLFHVIAVAICSIFASSNIVSITQLAPKATINGALITHYDSTKSPSDVYFTKVNVSPNAGMNPSFSTKWVKRTGSGTHTDVLSSPIVTAGVMSFIQVVATDDTLSSTVTTSTVKVVTPKFQPVAPTIASVSKNPTTTGIEHSVAITIGKDDSLIAQRDLMVDTLGTYLPSTRKWTLTKDGTINDTITGLNDGTQYFIKWTITNSVGTKVLKYAFTTLYKNHKPWIGTIIATPTITDKTIKKISWPIMGYGSLTDSWLTYNAQKSSALNLTGVGTQTCSMDLTNLTPSTVYVVKGFAKNLYGVDSVILGTFKTSAAAVKFYAHAANAIGGVNSGIGTGIYGQTTGSVATLTGAVYPGSDPQCTGSSLQSVTNDYTSTNGSVSVTFSNLLPGTYWFKFYGTCTTGEFDLDSPPVSFTVTTTGIREIEKEVISIFPNPAVDLLKLNVPFKDDCHVEIRNMVGQIVKDNILTSGEKEINVSNLPEGSYLLTIKTKDDGIKIARFIKSKA